MSAILLIPLLLATVTSTDAAEERVGYTIAPRDQLKIQVGQWQSAEGVYRAWEDVTGEYRVSAAGTISMPLVGAITAAGRTPDELAGEISDSFESHVGLADPVAAAVEIIEYRPIFVTGEVEKPGAFPWQPGLNAMQAVGLAGGIRRSSQIFLDGERHALSALGEYSIFRLRLWRNLARHGRLEAELAGRDQVDMPESLDGAPMADALVETEQQIMEARAHALGSSLAQISSLEQLLEQQIATLGEQIELRKHQVNLAREELESVSQLRDRGLTVQSRENTVERMVADLESRMLDLETARLEAQQRLNEAGRDKTDLMNEHRRVIVTELAETRTEIDELQARIETQRGLYAEAAQKGSGMFVLGDGQAPDLVRFRQDEQGELVSEVVSRSSALQPGDVLEVRQSELPQAFPQRHGNTLSRSGLPSEPDDWQARAAEGQVTGSQSQVKTRGGGS